MKTKSPIEVKDYFLTQEPFSLVKIKGLDVYKTTPRTKKEAIAKYYKSTKYVEKSKILNSFFPGISGKIRILKIWIDNIF